MSDIRLSTAQRKIPRYFLQLQLRKNKGSFRIKVLQLYLNFNYQQFVRKYFDTAYSRIVKGENNSIIFNFSFI